MKWVAAAVSLAAVVIVAINFIAEQREEPTIADGIRNNELHPPKEAAVTTSETVKFIETPTAESIFQQQYKLNFKPVTDALQPIQKVKASSVATDDRVRTINIDGQTYWIYTRPSSDDPTEVFIGLAAGSDLYDFGTIGGDVYAEEAAIDKVELFGASYMRLSGFCGANCAVDRYIRMKDGVPVQNIYFNFPTQIGDWNHDGQNELVYSDSSMPVNSILVRFQDDKLEAVSLMELLQAKGGVVYDSGTNTFNAYIPSSDKVTSFVFESGDKLVQNIK
ncbi:hypothetical protein DFQ01_1166 [Paenibacillus cellulosilyticus]|uniref:Uncharacterized protein n=1 Tax=Paenibacillus cellulosilyticus TaxID=375489 RepID=A0A2V2YQ58_9BACL|nr:hypothetical protein DFQ01_1166 [Paenibacillus cellulosilyticus]QKS43873.1 hypothetical protein HUB94_05070 [Paenibacillus cellulosilyticus]